MRGGGGGGEGGGGGRGEKQGEGQSAGRKRQTVEGKARVDMAMIDSPKSSLNTKLVQNNHRNVKDHVAIASHLDGLDAVKRVGMDSLDNRRSPPPLRTNASRPRGGGGRSPPLSQSLEKEVELFLSGGCGIAPVPPRKLILPPRFPAFFFDILAAPPLQASHSGAALAAHLQPPVSPPLLPPPVFQVPPLPPPLLSATRTYTSRLLQLVK